MAQRPLVSVVVPAYNRRESLLICLKGILSQTLKDFEVWVIDDGSSDGTGDAVRQMKDPRIHYVYQANQGVSAARNRGIAGAQGEWVAFCDSDDRWLPKKLEVQMSLLEKEKNLWAHSDEIWIRNGIRVNAHNKHAKPEGRIYSASLPLCAVSPSTAVIHQRVFKACGVFDALLPAAEDYDLWLRMASRFEISLAKEFLIEKTGCHPDQLSRTFVGLDRFRIRALRKHLDSEFLSAEEREATREMYLLKCRILEKGYEKHQKWIEADFYRRCRLRLESLMNLEG